MEKTLQAVLDVAGVGAAIVLDGSGRIIVDQATGETNRPGVYAAGDAVNGADLVVTAIASGRRAAQGIQLALTRARGLPATEWRNFRVPNVSQIALEFQPDGAVAVLPGW